MARAPRSRGGFEAADTPGSLIPATKVCGPAAAHFGPSGNLSSGCKMCTVGGLPRRVLLFVVLLSMPVGLLVGFRTRFFGLVV